ncbi:Cytochrome oxidase biogenesis protein Sco1/SenC/PrrC, thiol-disulfide reductase involved in Cu(I) insertion into CoxII Cu(A) center [hydrothermal vent metagenome]|uniref:Cytochrome oxidase biogenesis protein Sco1/SenC/PrrC, thiol-disulfide reductase involved in Cu(I) insertion into CoxII Cu(A) center n=1 Tax=hydrothermal vent metagenome TaxID=652676 RepID=A0A3B0ZSC7_9ZZZZ
MPQTNKNNNLILTAVAIVSVVVGVLVSQKLIKTPAAIPENLSATLLDKAKPLRNFELINHNNKPFNLNSLKGNWSFLFFGYTHCPDVCPLAMQVMRKVWRAPELKTVTASKMQMIFVSVDPDRDTPTLLKSYAQYYNPAFIGVTGKADEIDNITKQIGILYGFDEPNKNGDYNVSHSGQIILIDPQGNMRAVFSPPLNPKSITQDFIAIKKWVEDNT